MPKLHTVTTAELKDTLTSAERATMARELGPDADADAWLGACLLQACDRVVAAINSCERNVRILPGLCKVPAECVRTALALARHAMVSMVPAMAANLSDGARAAEYNSAQHDLAALAACELIPLYTPEEDELADTGDPGCAIIGRPAQDWFI